MGQVNSKGGGREEFGRENREGANMARVVTAETVHRGEEKRGRNGGKNYFPKI